jgi:hypothetical protein
MREYITHHLTRAQVAARVSIVGGVTDVSETLNSISRALSRIYTERTKPSSKVQLSVENVSTRRNPARGWGFPSLRICRQCITAALSCCARQPVVCARS